MLLPFEWAVLTIEEAKTLMSFIEKSTTTPAYPKNYDKMQKVGILEMYNKLSQFVEANAHQTNLCNLDLSQFD